MTDDGELMVEIKAHAEKAVEAGPNLTDASALATALAAEFPHRTVEEIREKIIDVWQARGIFCKG